MDGNEIDCMDDIWDGDFRYEKETEKPIIGLCDKEHKKLINSIILIAKEKYYNHICWTDTIKIQWINLAIEYKSISSSSQNPIYLPVDFSQLVISLDIMQK